MRDIKQSTATTRMVFMTDSADHLTGKTGLTLTITASKAGAAFAAITPIVTERGNGWYALDLTTTHANTQGDFALHVTGAGADPADLLFNVVANILGDTLPANTIQLAGQTVTAAAGVTFPSTVASPTNITAASGVALAASQHVIVDSGTVTTLTNLPAITANWLTAAGVASAALNGKGDWNTTTPPTAAAIRAEMDANSTDLDAIGMLAAGIKAKTDLIPAAPASTTNITAGTITTVSGNVAGSVGSVTNVVSANVTKVNGVTITGAGVTTADEWRPA